MARGDHPRRTPVYGGLLILVAMVGATLVVYQGGSWPGWLRTVLLVLAIPLAVAGWLLTFRDLTPPRRGRGR
jgi:UDP-N-acetylmuramyl pentapeptide phosphotransferase/UDP-N-acetylglucosamine-1-phosphate transferase